MFGDDVQVFREGSDDVFSWSRRVMFVVGDECVSAYLLWGADDGYELVFDDDGSELSQRCWGFDELYALDEATCGD